MRVPSVGGTERIPSFASTTKLSEPDRDRARPPPEPYEVSPRAPRFFASTPATCTSSEKIRMGAPMRMLDSTLS